MKEALPGGNHFFGAGEAVSTRIDKGVVLTHVPAQSRGIACVNGGDES